MKFIFLTQDFYNAYASCHEIEQKPLRPYIKVCVTVGGIDFAIPLRSNINHPHVLWTDKTNKCGLDFSKTVVVAKPHYIDSAQPYIRQNEFDSLRGKEYIVETKLIKYIKDYKKAKQDLSIRRNQELCQYSTLQYFESYITDIN